MGHVVPYAGLEKRSDAAEVKAVLAFPVKGARGLRPAALRIDPAVGVVGDRRFAVKRRPDQPDEWAAKVHFRVCMNTPQMAAQMPALVECAEAAGGLSLDPCWLQELAVALGTTRVATLDTRGAYNLVDTNPLAHGPTVSFLNLASVRELEAETGWRIDPERFRMNVWYDDRAPFSELAWADSYPGTREFTVGDLAFRVQDACERCPAIEANPATGTRDLRLLDALEYVLTKRGYAGSPHRGSLQVMGFLATPLTAGEIAPGQTMRMSS